MVFGSFSEALNKYSYERYGHTPEIKQILFYFRYRCFAEPNYWQALLKHSCVIGVLSYRAVSINAPAEVVSVGDVEAGWNIG